MSKMKPITTMRARGYMKPMGPMRARLRMKPMKSLRNLKIKGDMK